jgi:thiosulfate/3-mercaptopyruvate sulfurtransferase
MPSSSILQKMKKCHSLIIAFFAFFAFLSFQNLNAQTGSKPWTQDELLDPSKLAVIINEPNAEKPVIFNIGPLGDIKGAVDIGPAKDKSNLEKFRQALAKIPKDKMVVIYCGCCPFKNCPNVRPAFTLLKEMKFSKPRLLNLPHNLKIDWLDPGYPMN